jgi:hypothetical protein
MVNKGVRHAQLFPVEERHRDRHASGSDRRFRHCIS